MNDEEKFLIDFMSEGSTVANLIFDLSLTKLLIARNASFISVSKSQECVNERAKQVRTKVFKIAFRELPKFRVRA